MRTVKQYSIEQFMNTERIGGCSFSPDEQSILFHTNKTDIFNVFTVPVMGGLPKQLTDSKKESMFAVSYFPNDMRFLYTCDHGGNENHHLYVMESDGQERDLTPGENIKANFLGWSHDKASFFYSSNERDPRFFDIYEMRVSSFVHRRLFQDETGYLFGAISNDKQYIALRRLHSTADADIFLYNVTSHELEHLTPHTGEIIYSPQTFDPASEYLYYLTDAGSEFQYVARYHLATGQHEVVEKASWDIWAIEFSRNGRYRITVVNEDARTVLRMQDTVTGTLVPLPTLPDGDIMTVKVSDSERLMAFYHHGDRSPANLYVHDFAACRTTRLTDSLNPQINPLDLVESQVIRYRSFDGLQIPAILYKPHQAGATHKVPAVVLVHGGPGGQARKGYKADVQFLVNHGYTVLDVNNRGSSGYGKSFFTADVGKHGREPLWDVVEGKKYLTALDYVDPDKIGIMGGSYGGYMVLAALAFKPEEFAVGVDLFGISNWIRTLRSIPAYWEAIRTAFYKKVGDPETDMDNLRAISPLFHADKIRKPLLVIQGANDPRVIKPESDEIVQAVKRTNGIVEYLVFEDEGHGFIKKANEIHANRSILSFLDRYLRDNGQASDTTALGS
jgi:dipeptidyl aminopeptidase/acylaminoacyl peptidase